MREFVLATELYKIGDSPAWPGFLKRVRAVYHGTVSYAAVMKQYFNTPGQLPPVPDMGLDTYPSLPLPDSASQRQVTAGWERYLGKDRLTLLRRTAMDEVSIAGTTGSYKLPADWNRPGRPDPEIQARWFTAACMTAVHFHMRAVYFYELRMSADPAQRLAYPAFFAGKPGAKAISNCRAILRG